MSNAEQQVGTVTAEGPSGVVGVTAAHAVLEAAAAEIATAIAGAVDPDARVLLVGEGELAPSDWPYHHVVGQLTELAGEVQEVAGWLAGQAPRPGEGDRVTLAGAAAAVTALAAAAPALAGIATEVAGALQSSYRITGHTVTADTRPAVVALAGALTAEGLACVVDGLHAVPDTAVVRALHDLQGEAWGVQLARIDLEQRELEPALAEVRRRSAELERRLEELRAAEEAASAGEGPSDGADPEAAAADRVRQARDALHAAEVAAGRWRQLVEAAKAVEQRVATFVAGVTAPTPDGGLPLLAQAALREPLHAGRTRVTHVLQVGVDAAGAETQVRQRRFAAPTVRHVGACTLSVLLADLDGTVRFARTLPLVGDLTYELSSGAVGTLRTVPLSR